MQFRICVNFLVCVETPPPVFRQSIFQAVRKYFKFCLQNKRKCISAKPQKEGNTHWTKKSEETYKIGYILSIIENLHTPGKEVNKMQDAYHYIQAILSTGHVCRSMIFMIYLSHKTECQICKNQGNKQKKKNPPKLKETKKNHKFCLNCL